MNNNLIEKCVYVIEIFDSDAENKIKNVFGDKDAKVYIIG